MTSKHSMYSTLNVYQFPPKTTEDLIVSKLREFINVTDFILIDEEGE